MVPTDACLCFTQLVIQLRPFANRGIVELLSRTSGIADRLEEVLDLSANMFPGTVHLDRWLPGALERFRDDRLEPTAGSSRIEQDLRG